MMESEKITMFRTNADKTEIIEQLPKTVTSQVYDSDNEQFLHETITAINAHTKEESDKKHIEVVSSVPNDLTDSGIFFQVDGSSPDVPSTITVDVLNENVLAVAEKLEQKVWYFPTVASMKNARMLKNGNVVITSGFYNENDGGGATYKVGSSTADGYFTHALGNGLTATLIIEYDTVNFRQIGARSEQDVNFVKFDNKVFLLAYLNYLNNSIVATRIKLYIPSGVWCFSETHLYRPRGYHIFGDKSFIHKGETISGTIITAKQNNQRYVWKCGGKENPSSSTTVVRNTNIIIDDLTFSTASFNSNGLQTIYSVQNSALYVDQLKFGYIGKLNFAYISGTGLIITTSWEMYWDILNFRNIDNHSKPCVLFDDLTDSTGNISALEFAGFMFEACNGDYIKVVKGAVFGNSKIKSIQIEANFFDTTTGNAVTTGTATNGIEYTQRNAVLKLEQLNNLHIDSIVIEKLGRFVHSADSKTYIIDRVIDTGQSDGVLNLVINSIQFIENSKDIIILNSDNSNSNQWRKAIVINDVLSYANSDHDFIPKFEVKNFPTLVVKNVVKNGYFGGNLAEYGIAPLTLPLYKYAYARADGGRITTDNGATNALKLCVKSYSNIGKRVATIPTLNGHGFKIRAKIPNEVTARITFLSTISGSSAYRTVSVIGTGSFEWYDTLPNTSVFDDDVVINIQDEDGIGIVFDCIRYEKVQE